MFKDLRLRGTMPAMDIFTSMATEGEKEFMRTLAKEAGKLEKIVCGLPFVSRQKQQTHTYTHDSRATLDYINTDIIC